MHHDPTAHAEIVAIRRLCAKLNTTNLKGYTIYCTLQPCGMCTMACLWAGISRIVYGAGRDDVTTSISNLDTTTQSTSFEMLFVMTSESMEASWRRNAQCSMRRRTMTCPSRRAQHTRTPRLQGELVVGATISDQREV
jgi:tRNA(Arg) A34 adenosine deaminase TadA